MTRIFYYSHLSYFNPFMLKNPSNKLSSSWYCRNSSPYMHLLLGSLSKSYWSSVMPPLLYYACQPSSCICKGPMGGSRWSDALLCLTENCRWSRRTHRIYLPNYFLLGCYPPRGRDVPWSVWGKLGFWPFQTWLLGRIPGWCRWLLSPYWWHPRPWSW